MELQITIRSYTAEDKPTLCYYLNSNIKEDGYSSGDYVNSYLAHQISGYSALMEEIRETVENFYKRYPISDS